MSESRLELWRKAIYLLSKFESKSGPFAKCGFSQFIIEYKTKSNHKLDIVAWNPEETSFNSKYYVLELTIDLKKDKTKQLQTYSALEPLEFFTIGIQSNNKPIVILVSPIYLHGYDDYCQIVLGKELTSHNTDKLDNNCIECNLKETIDLTHVPQTSFTIVPECKNTELKLALIDILMLTMSSKYNSFTAEDVTNIGLDYISDKIYYKEKKNLTKRVSQLLIELSKNQLKQYLIFDKGVFRSTEKGKNIMKYASSRKAFNDQMQHWARTKNTSLEQWNFDSEE